MQNKPAYPVEAVDNALRILIQLGAGQAVRVTDAAHELGVARSTAHRLLQALVYRRFAVQRDDRVYVAGPALSPYAPHRDHVFLKGWLRPALRALHRDLDETVHLMVRDGSDVLFLESLEARRALKVGSRTGVRMPAEHTSGGKALLAQLSRPALRSLYSGREDVDLPGLERILDRTRRNGYGLNTNESERGISAVGVCLPEPSGEPFVAITVSAPSVRFRAAQARDTAALIRAAITESTRHWEI